MKRWQMAALAAVVCFLALTGSAVGVTLGGRSHRAVRRAHSLSRPLRSAKAGHGRRAVGHLHVGHGSYFEFSKSQQAAASAQVGRSVFPVEGAPAPENPQVAAASRLRYSRLSRRAALRVDRRSFPGVLSAPAFDVQRPHGYRLRLIRRLNAHSAVEQPQSGRRVVVQSSLPVFDAQTRSGKREPLNLSLSPITDGSYAPSAALAPVSIPASSDGKIQFSDPGFSVQFSTAAAVSGQPQGSSVFYPNVDGIGTDTDAVVAPLPGGAEVSWVLRSALSPATHTLTFALPQGWKLQQQPDGFIAVVNASDAEQLVVLPPIAVDADRHNVPTQMQVIPGNRVLVSVAPTTPVTYPIYLDPDIEEDNSNGSSDWDDRSLWTPNNTGQFQPNDIGAYETWEGATSTFGQPNNGLYFHQEPSGAWAYMAVASDVNSAISNLSGSGYVGESAGINDGQNNWSSGYSVDGYYGDFPSSVIFMQNNDPGVTQFYCVNTNCDDGLGANENYQPYLGDEVEVPGESTAPAGANGTDSGTPYADSDAITIYELDNVTPTYTQTSTPTVTYPINTVPTGSWINPQTEGYTTDTWRVTWNDTDSSGTGLGLSSFALSDSDGNSYTTSPSAGPAKPDPNNPLPCDSQHASACETQVPVSATIDVASLPQGVDTFTATSQSLTGLTGTSTFDIDIDETPPTASVSCTGGGGWVTSSTCTVTGSDPENSNGTAGSGLASLAYETENGSGGWSSPQSISNGGTFQVSSGGTTQVRAVATDNASNSFTSDPTSVRLDNTAPTVSFAGSLYQGQSGSQSSTSPTLTGPVYELDMNGSDSGGSGVAEIDVSVDGGPATRFPGQCTEAPPASDGCTSSFTADFRYLSALYGPGHHEITAVAKSFVGTTSQPGIFYVYTAPAVSLGQSQSQSQNGTLGLEPFYDYRTTQTGAGSSLNVNLGTGNGVWDWTPIVDKGQGLASFVQLTYNSQAQLSDLNVTADGKSAVDDGYDQAGVGFSVGIDGLTRLNEPLDLSALNQGSGAVSFTDIDGTSHTFVKDENGNWVSPPGVFLHLTQWPTYDPSNPSSWYKAWSITRPDGVTFFFDPLGYETSIEDRTGNTITFNNDFSGGLQSTVCNGTVASAVASADESQDVVQGCQEQVQSVTDQGGRSIQVKYTQVGQDTVIDHIIDHAGHVLQFHYDNSSGPVLLTNVTYADTRSFSFGWGGNNDSKTSLSLLGTSPQSSVVPAPVVAIDPSLAGVTGEYFPEHLTSIQDPNGNTTSLAYQSDSGSGSDPCPVGQDSSSQLAAVLNVEPVCVSAVTARDGGQTTYSYATSTSSGSRTQTATITGPAQDAYGNGESWVDTTDQYFRPITQIDPLGRETTTVWNDVGGANPQACGNAPDQPVSEGVAANTMASQTTGLVISGLTPAQEPSQTAAPAQTNYCYDQNGETTERQGPFDPDSNESPTFRDIVSTYQQSAGAALLLPQGDADAGGTFVSDLLTRSVSSANGTETTSYTYDKSDPDDGLVTQVKDPDGQLWTTSYYPGTGGEPSSDGSGSVDQGGGLIESETDPDGNTTSYANYDPNGLAGKVTLPGQKDPSYYDYDSDGNLLAVSDPRGGPISDPTPLGDGANLAPYTTYYAYDAYNDLFVTYTPHDMASGVWNVSSSAYDANGNITSTVDGAQVPADGSDPSGGTSTAYGYTAMDQLQSKSVQGVPDSEASAGTSAQTTSYCRDLNGDVTFETLPAGQPNNSTYTCAAGQSAPTDHAVSDELDGDGETLAQIQLSDTVGSQDQITSYAYDARGNQTAESDPADNAGDDWMDAVDNVPTGKPTSAGNWDSATVYDSADEKVEQVTNPQIIASNGSAEIYVERDEYDAAGNLLATESPKESDANNSQADQSVDASTGQFSFAGESNMTSYTYNDRNLLVSDTNPDGDETLYGRYPDGKICWTLSPRGVAADSSNLPSTDDCSSATQSASYMTGYTYTPEGWLASINLPQAAGEYSYGSEPMSVTYSRDQVGDPTQIVDPRGTAITNTFYADGELESTSAPWWWNYDASGSGQSLDPNDGSMGQLSAETPSEGQVSETTLSDLYKANSDSDSASAPLPSDGISGNLGDVPAQSLPGILSNAGDTQLTYNGQGWLTAVTDSLGDQNGTFTASDQATTYLSYDPDGQLLDEKQPGTGSQSETSYSYDPDGNTLSMSSPPRATLAAGSVSPQAVANGDSSLVTPTTTYTYDGLDRMTSETAPGASTDDSQSPSPQVTQYCYYLAPSTQSPGYQTGDSNGCPSQSQSGSQLTVAEPSGASVTVAQRVLEINPNQNDSTVDYDQAGNELASTDPLGDMTVKGYDELGDEISVTRPNGETASSPTPTPYTTTDTYDQAGQLTQSTDGSGHTTTDTYDPDGNLIQQDSPGAGGASGASAQPQVTAYAYNGRDLLWKTTTGLNPDASAGPDTRTTVTETDGDGNVIRSVNSAGAGISSLANPYYAYNGDYTATPPQSASSQSSADQQANIDATIDTYDANNQLTASYLPWGCDLTSNTASNRQCQLSGITDSRRWMISYSRTTNNGNPTAGDWIYGVSQAYDWTQPSPAEAITTYHYDANGWISEADSPQLKDDPSDPDHATQQTTQYNYDPAGDETKQFINANGPTGTLPRTSFRSWWPDGQPQQLDVAGTDSSKRSYDYLFTPDGELSGISGLTTTYGGQTITASSDTVCYDAADRPLVVGEVVPGGTDAGTNQEFSTAYSYDADGNVTQRGDNGYSNTYCPQVTSSFSADGYTTGQISSFTYDNLDREQSQSIKDNGSQSLSGEVQPTRTFANTYWPSGQMETQSRRIGSGTAVNEAWYYTPSGQVAEDTRTTGTAAQPNYDQDFTYDSDDNATSTENGTHLYNALNQEVQWTRGGPNTLDPGGTSTYTLTGDGALLQEVDNLSYTNVPQTSTTPGTTVTESANETIVTRHCANPTGTQTTPANASQAEAAPMCSLDDGRTENIQTTSTITGSATGTVTKTGKSTTQSFGPTTTNTTQQDCYDSQSELIEVVQAPDTCTGNPSAATSSQYNYSDLGVEVNQTVPDPSGKNTSQTLTTSYQYDALGRRALTTLQLSGTTPGSTADAYVGLSLKAISQDGNVTASGADALNTYDYDSAEQPIGTFSDVDSQSPNVQTYSTYAKDPDGTIQGLESSTGKIATDNAYHYTPYGEPELGSNQDTNPLGTATTQSTLTQAAQLNETGFQGFQYNQGGSPDPAQMNANGDLSSPALPQSDSFTAPARNYLPGQGMWQSPDTFEDSGADQSVAAGPLTQDPYTFVAGNPTTNIENDGHGMEVGMGGQEAVNTRIGNTVHTYVTAGPGRGKEFTSYAPVPSPVAHVSDQAQRQDEEQQALDREIRELLTKPLTFTAPEHEDIGTFLDDHPSVSPNSGLTTDPLPEDLGSILITTPGIDLDSGLRPVGGGYTPGPAGSTLLNSSNGDAGQEGGSGGESGGSDDGGLLKPGPFAGGSIPARGPGRDFTPEERGQINDIGSETGCHTCGSTDPGTKSGNFVPDHQPPTAINPEGEPQDLYPQCLACSRQQGLELARRARGNS